MAEFIMVYPPGIPILLPGRADHGPQPRYIREHSKPASLSRDSKIQIWGRSGSSQIDLLI